MNRDISDIQAETQTRIEADPSLGNVMIQSFDAWLGTVLNLAAPGEAAQMLRNEGMHHLADWIEREALLNALTGHA